MHNAKCKIIVCASRMIPIVAAGDTTILHFEFSILHFTGAAVFHVAGLDDGRLWVADLPGDGLLLFVFFFHGMLLCQVNDRLAAQGPNAKCKMHNAKLRYLLRK